MFLLWFFTKIGWKSNPDIVLVLTPHWQYHQLEQFLIMHLSYLSLIVEYFSQFLSGVFSWPLLLVVVLPHVAIQKANSSLSFDWLKKLSSNQKPDCPNRTYFHQFHKFTTWSLFSVSLSLSEKSTEFIFRFFFLVSRRLYSFSFSSDEFESSLSSS